LVPEPAAWRWSSVHAHLSGREDGITAIGPIRDLFPDFAGFIADDPEPAALARLRRAESIGRPVGEDAFLERLEAATRRRLKPGKRRPKARDIDSSQQPML
jgi:putative transposase